MATAFEGARPSRRIVARGAIWAMPVVVVGAAATSAAASAEPVVLLSGVACKDTGTGSTKNYVFTFTVTNSTAKPASVTVTKVTINGNNMTGFTSAGNPIPAGGGPFTVTVPSSNFANGTAIITYDVTLADGTSYTLDATATFNPLPPC